MAFPRRALAIFYLVVLMQSVTAKRGCSAFGHSCFGGHGKRSGISADDDMATSESFTHQQLSQEETPPHPWYPRPEILPSGDNIIPIRDGGFYDHEDNASMKEMMKLRLKNIVKRWMDNYRKSQRISDYGLIVD